MGRKRNPRQATINVRVTAEEKAKFEQLAEARNTEVSEIVRQLLHREADAVRIEQIAGRTVPQP